MEDKIYIVFKNFRSEVKAVKIVQVAEIAESSNDNGEVTSRTTLSKWTEYRIEPLDTQKNASNTPPAQDRDKVDTTDTRTVTEEK